ncbi:MAG: 30S ribosomal protein S17 [bacterium]|nr:30S ribosomal protein S17 [bacterium]
MPKRLTGEVVSIKGSMTVVVDVERKFAHPLYKKIIKRNKRYIVHNELYELNLGDQVTIEETRPISKTKRFKVVSKIEN